LQSLKEYGNTTIFLDLSLTTLSTWFIFYSDKLMPDIYVALAVFAAIFAIINIGIAKVSRTHLFMELW